MEEWKPGMVILHLHEWMDGRKVAVKEGLVDGYMIGQTRVGLFELT